MTQDLIRLLLTSHQSLCVATALATDALLSDCLRHAAESRYELAEALAASVKLRVHEFTEFDGSSSPQWIAVDAAFASGDQSRIVQAVVACEDHVIRKYADTILRATHNLDVLVKQHRIVVHQCSMLRNFEEPSEPAKLMN